MAKAIAANKMATAIAIWRLILRGYPLGTTRVASESAVSLAKAIAPRALDKLLPRNEARKR